MSTIAAIATATGAGGIGIIRMSGEKCFEVLKKIFVPKNKNIDLDEVKGYTIKYGYIINPKNNHECYNCTSAPALFFVYCSGVCMMYCTVCAMCTA